MGSTCQPAPGQPPGVSLSLGAAPAWQTCGPAHLGCACEWIMWVVWCVCVLGGWGKREGHGGGHLVGLHLVGQRKIRLPKAREGQAGKGQHITASSSPRSAHALWEDVLQQLQLCGGQGHEAALQLVAVRHILLQGGRAWHAPCKHEACHFCAGRSRQGTDPRGNPRTRAEPGSAGPRCGSQWPALALTCATSTNCLLVCLSWMGTTVTSCLQKPGGDEMLLLEPTWIQQMPGLCASTRARCTVSAHSCANISPALRNSPAVLRDHGHHLLPRACQSAAARAHIRLPLVLLLLPLPLLHLHLSCYCSRCTSNIGG